MLLLWSLCLLCSSTPYETVVRGAAEGDRAHAAQQQLDASSPGFATLIHLPTEAAAAASEAMPDVLAHAPSATVRSLGGLGQYSSISLRGSSTQQVALFLDGAPLSGSSGVLLSLADLPLPSLDRLEIFRGYVPVQYGSNALGGVINLATRPATGSHRLHLDSGVGSFGARQLGTSLEYPLDANTSLVARLTYSGANGDFRYFNNRATLQTPADDTFSIRQNNGYDRWLAQLRYETRRGPWRLSAQQLLASKAQGIPGTDNVQTSRTHLQTTLLKTILSARRSGFWVPTGTLEWVGAAGLEWRHLSNPWGELGRLAGDEQGRDLDVYLSPRVRLPLWRNAFLTAAGDGRYETALLENQSPLNLTASTAPARLTRRRLAYGAGVELEQHLWDERLLLVPSVRLDWLRSYFQTPASTLPWSQPGTNSAQNAVSPRLGTRLRLTRGLEWRASVGRYFRAPSLLELFGDRGFMVGNPALKPEHGTNADCGWVLDAASSRYGAIYAQVAAFAQWSRDAIEWSQASFVTRPENIAAGARLHGVEAALQASTRRRLQLQANYTFLDAANRTPPQSTDARGRSLPGRPRHEVFARLSLGHPVNSPWGPGMGRLFYQVDYLAGTFLDTSARLALPARQLHGAGLELVHQDAWRVTVEVRNLFNVTRTTWRPPGTRGIGVAMPVADFLGYPLPGRSFWLSVAVDFDWTAPGEAAVSGDQAS